MTLKEQCQDLMHPRAFRRRYDPAFPGVAAPKPGLAAGGIPFDAKAGSVSK